MKKTDNADNMYEDDEDDDNTGKTGVIDAECPDFTIKARAWQIAVSVICAAGSLAGFGIALFFCLSGRMEDSSDLIPIGLICALFFIIGGVGIFVCARQKFSYSKGIITWCGGFTTKQVNMRLVKYCFTGIVGKQIMLVFFDGSGNEIFSYADESNILSSDQFVSVMEVYNPKMLSEPEYITMKEKSRLRKK